LKANLLPATVSAMTRSARRAVAFASAILFGIAVASPACAQSGLDGQFRTWLQNDLWPSAKAEGITKATFDSAFAGVNPNPKLPDLVLPGQKAKTPKKQLQSEFGSPGA